MAIQLKLKPETYQLLNQLRDAVSEDDSINQSKAYALVDRLVSKYEGSHSFKEGRGFTTTAEAGEALGILLKGLEGRALSGVANVISNAAESIHIVGRPAAHEAAADLREAAAAEGVTISSGAGRTPAAAGNRPRRRRGQPEAEQELPDADAE